MSATVECPHCNLTGEHRIQCPGFTGQIDRESLARFLFDHSNASNDGARVMEMMDSMARGLLEHLEVSRKVGF
jgi:hypothetical protein